jgi:hypothetical protein
MEAPMTDPLDHTEVTGTISTPRHAAVRFRAGHECGDLFAEGDEYDGFTLTIEVSGLDDARAMVEAIRADLPPTPEQIASDPRVHALVEALQALRFESLCLKGDKRGTLRMALNRADAALAAFRAEGGE